MITTITDTYTPAYYAYNTILFHIILPYNHIILLCAAYGSGTKGMPPPRRGSSFDLHWNYNTSQSVSFSGNRFPRVSFQIREKKRARSKIHSGVLGSFWKRDKSKGRTILPGSYTTIFFSTFIFHRNFLMFKPCRSKNMDFHWFLLIFLTGQ